MSPRRRDDQTRTFREDDEPRRPQRGKKRRPEKERGNGGAVIALVAVVLLAGAVAGGLWWRSRRIAPTMSPTADASPQPTLAPAPAGPSDLDAAIADADRLDPGWRWEQLVAKREAVPASDNSARYVLEAQRFLPSPRTPPPEFFGLLDQPAGTRFTEPQLTELTSWVRARAAALKPALALADRPRGRFDVQVSPDFLTTLLPHVDAMMAVRTLLRAEARRRAEAGDPGNLAEFRAMVNLGRSIGDEPFNVSQIVRMASVNAAVLNLEQTLARTAPDDPALASAQKTVGAEIGYPSLEIAYRGERASLFGMYHAVDTGVVTAAQINEKMAGSSPPISWPADVAPGSVALRQAQAWQLRRMTRLVEVAKKPIPEWPAALAKAREATPPAPAAARFLEPLGDLFDEALPRAAQRREATVRSAVVALAAERYRRKNGRWPLEPKEMDPSQVGPVPADPFDGAPLRFRRLDDGLVVYSIGPDGRDDGGDLGDRQKNEPDIGFRLWDADRRR
jgi:hypothetical protein